MSRRARTELGTKEPGQVRNSADQTVFLLSFFLPFFFPHLTPQIDEFDSSRLASTSTLLLLTLLYFLIMPSLAHTVGGAALLFAVATNAAGHVDNKPIHLRSERSNLRKRVAQPSSVDSQTSTNLLASASLPPPRQDSIYASPDFKSEKTTQRINQLLQTNVEAATEAIKLGKNDPTVNVDAGMTKRAKPGPNWRWDFNGSTPIRGVNLGGWLVTEVNSSRFIFPIGIPR